MLFSFVMKASNVFVDRFLQPFFFGNESNGIESSKQLGLRGRMDSMEVGFWVVMGKNHLSNGKKNLGCLGYIG